jgi:hydrogenase maturation protein HypF
VAVQHHHAHVASAMAEHGLEGPVLGVAFDGTGYGTDGTAWGGELLVADYARFERVARLRPVRLPGGDRAVHEVWRTALALLDDAFDGDPPLARLALFGAIAPRAIATMRRMIAARLNAPFASGLGRYFDAVGAIGLVRARATYEGQVAMAWDQAADASERGAYPFSIDVATTPWTIDLRATVRAATLDLLSGRSVGTVSARFHESIVAATAEAARRVIAVRGALPIVLTGGCFQNTRLAEGLIAALAPSTTVHLHERVPPGDGGIALGQAMIADAIARAG